MTKVDNPVITGATAPSGTQDPSSGGSVFSRFALGGDFALMVMTAILDMSQAQTNKTALDSGLSQILANADANYMTYAQQQLQAYYNTNLAPEVNKSNPTQTDTNNIGLYEQTYNTMQSQFQAEEQQMKSVTSGVANTVSADNTNSSDFYQFATTSVQILGYAVQMLQHSMG